MKAQLGLCLVGISLVTGLTRCGETPIADAPLVLSVTDASAGSNTDPGGDSAGYEHLYVVIEEVAIRSAGESSSAQRGDDGYQVLTSTPITVDLVTLNQGGLSQLLASASLVAGTYSEFRLTLSQASLVSEGTLYPVQLSTGAVAGLAASTDLVLSSGLETRILLNLAGVSSVQYSPVRGYTMTPTLSVLSVETDGNSLPVSPTPTPFSDEGTPADDPDAPIGTEPEQETTPTATPASQEPIEIQPGGMPDSGPESSPAPDALPSPTPGIEPTAVPGPIGTDPGGMGESPEASTPSPTPVQLPDPGGF